VKTLSCLFGEFVAELRAVKEGGMKACLPRANDVINLLVQDSQEASFR